MGFQGEATFPIIPQPMALAADALSGSSRRSPVPSNLVDNRRRGSSNDNHNNNNHQQQTQQPQQQQQQSRRKPKRRSTLLNEDVFSRLLSGPLLIVHFALYCAVPVCYLVHLSPFSHFGPGLLNQLVRWVLLGLTQYLTAVLMVSWDGHYRVRREVLALLGLVAGVFAVGGLRGLVEGVTMARAGGGGGGGGGSAGVTG